MRLENALDACRFCAHVARLGVTWIACAALAALDSRERGRDA